MNPFKGFFRQEAKWCFAGLSSSFPDLELEDNNLAHPRYCNADLGPGCKVFHVPSTDPSQGKEVPVVAEAPESSGIGEGLKDQVLVFKYRDKIHAVNHVSQAH